MNNIEEVKKLLIKMQKLRAWLDWIWTSSDIVGLNIWVTLKSWEKIKSRFDKKCLINLWPFISKDWVDHVIRWCESEIRALESKSNK